MLTDALYIIMAFVGSIAMHEFGHIWTINHYGYKHNIKFSLKEISIDYETPTKAHNKRIILAGVVLGLIPFVWLSDVIHSPKAAIICACLYMLGCIWDLQKLGILEDFEDMK